MGSGRSSEVDGLLKLLATIIRRLLIEEAQEKPQSSKRTTHVPKT